MLFSTLKVKLLVPIVNPTFGPMTRLFIRFPTRKRATLVGPGPVFAVVVVGTGDMSQDTGPRALYGRVLVVAGIFKLLGDRSGFLRSSTRLAVLESVQAVFSVIIVMDDTPQNAAGWPFSSRLLILHGLVLASRGGWVTTAVRT
jgi:hypothetical protein